MGRGGQRGVRLLLAGLLLAWAGTVAGASEPVVYTNRDLPPPLPSGTLESSARAEAPELPPLTYATYTDRKGRDEAWWREAIAVHLVEVAEADEELHRTYRSLELHLPGVDHTRYRWSTSRDFLQARDHYLQAQTRVDALAQQWDELMEDARTSAALPGWLRRSGAIPARRPASDPSADPCVVRDGPNEFPYRATETW